MSETTAALLAAIIGAGAAIYAGMLAHRATSGQADKTANAQRDQALWELRRDTYTRYIFAAKECARIHSENYAGERFQEISAAIEELQRIYVQMELEAPDGGDILLMARSLIEHFKELRTLASDHREAAGSSRADAIRTRLRDETRDLNLTIAMMQEAVRAEVNRKAA
ncbi:hypothetical protein [Streptomyces niveus]|uniref:hypothetical protein n=1 Tax=Streptomyces niveus TaxID=193462 RepID=UPI0033A32070